jgi:two-component system, cell cycle response regulator
LLENARKFHPHGAPAVHVAATLSGTGGIRLTIGDDGRTLSPEHLARAGMPFFQGEKNYTGEVPGMGLGLASVFTLVWQAGGTCSLSNQPAGPGVRVELTWPGAAIPAEPAGEMHGARTFAAPETPSV